MYINFLTSIAFQANKPPSLVLALFLSPRQTGSLNRRVPSLSRLRAVQTVLSAASMLTIEKILWNHGRGPLATEGHISGSELRHLIKALYCSSALRDQLVLSIR